MYFKDIPSIYYNFKIGGKDQLSIIKDITHNVRFRKEILSNITLYDEYDIRDGETPEIIAERVYGNPNYHWIIMLINEKYDYLTDFPLTYNELVEHTTLKYGADYINDANYFLDFNGNRVESNIKSVTITNAGSGYISTDLPPAVTFGPTTSPRYAINAIGQAVLSGGSITAISMNTQGSGYTEATVTIVGGNGTGATAQAVISGGKITGISMITNGSGYTAQPSVVIYGDGSNAVASTATITTSSIIGVKLISSGRGYRTAPSVTIAPPPSGTQATATAEITAVGVVSNLQYEEIENEKKRRIKLISPDLLNTILTNYKDLM
jgi:hypothetical protein